MIKFSVIIPVYNVEKYLEQCISSVLEQKYKDFEIILVNDGSTDNSAKICNQFEKNNKCIKVVHKQNGGLSDARNVGINNACGEYLIFLDSDDYWEDDAFLSKLDKIIKNNKSDLVLINSKKYFELANKLENKKNNLKEGKYSIEELLKDNIYKACAWNKIVKKDIIVENKVYFPKGRLSEDIEWCSRLLKLINLNNIYYLSDEIYIYRQRENSISKKVNDKFLNDIYEMITNEMKNVKKDEENIIYSYLSYEYTGLLGWTSLRGTDNDLKKNIYSLKKLLKYNINKKVKFAYYTYKIFGIRLTSYMLGKYIKLKNR